MLRQIIFVLLYGANTPAARICFDYEIFIKLWQFEKRRVWDYFPQRQMLFSANPTRSRCTHLQSNPCSVCVKSSQLRITSYSKKKLYPVKQQKAVSDEFKLKALFLGLWEASSNLGMFKPWRRALDSFLKRVAEQHDFALIRHHRGTSRTIT